ncbi:MAG: hypothetical protein ACXU87_06030 [Xanthobacteraceae bacterium]
MSLLLDNLMDALPLLGELTSAAIPHALERQLPPMILEMWRVLSSLGIVELMHHWGLAVIGCTGLFLILYGVHLADASRSTQDASVVKVKVWVAEGEWRGAAAVGSVVGGILILLAGLWSHQLNLPGF